MSKFFLIIIFVFVTSAVKLIAQDECEVTLNHALESFNSGHFASIPDLLKDCLNKNKNREWKHRAYLLLTETYLLLDDPLKAEESYVKVLRANPEFKPQADRDPIDLVYLGSNFTTTSGFSAFGRIGVNTSPVRVINDVDIGGESFNEERYFLKVGWNASLGVEWLYNKNISFFSELGYNVSLFKHQTINLFGLSKDIVQVTDKQSSLSLPISIKYNDSKGRVRPYGYLGYAANVLIKDVANIQTANNDLVEEDGEILIGEKSFNIIKSEIPSINFKDKRKIFTQSVLVGAGLKYKVKLAYFMLDLRYSIGLNNVVNPTYRYEGTVYRSPYVDDDFRLDNIIMSIGYSKPIYKPKKIKVNRKSR